MSDDSGYAPRGNGGCLDLLIAGALCFIALALAAAGSGGDATTTTSNTRSGVGSGNQVEVMSRNQLNLWSEVWNCYGDASCLITTDESATTSSTTTNAPVEVTGERNTVVSTAPTVFPDGVLRCYDAVAQAWTAEECSKQGVTQ